MGGCVLVVDDDEAIRQLFATLAKKLDRPFVFAGSGKEALEQFESQKPALLFLDITMPDMSGLAVLKKIKQTLRKENSSCRIIMLSARSTDADIQMAMAYGADGYIIKPISFLDLTAAVEKHLADLS